MIQKLSRRRFVQSIAAAVALPSAACDRVTAPTSELLPDPGQLLDLRDGFSYSVVSQVGTVMNDGLLVPGKHDGMAAFPAAEGRIRLICNHEIKPLDLSRGAFGPTNSRFDDATHERAYDSGGRRTPGLGGTTTTVYNPQTRKVERQFLSLAGTEINCAGGATPWNSWLSCEECFTSPGEVLESDGQSLIREQRHGYIFEVSSSADGLVEPVPLKAMGRFEHEAAAVHASTGIVYLTEDRWHSLFYRFLPDTPGKLHEGGRLQALAIADEPAKRTHNWNAQDVILNVPMATCWIELEDVDTDENDLRKRGAAAGAAMFARGEGIAPAGDAFAFTCTIGGPARLGQIFSYQPSPFEGTSREAASPGQLSLIAEADSDSLLKNCDNLIMAPWGDLIVCEDTAGECALVGVRPDGSQYLVANNAYEQSELAGVCFSPDGQTMFVNIQHRGLTLAVTGPWGSLHS